MAVVESAIQIALQRAERLGEDLAALADRYRDSSPSQNADPRETRQRAEFLRQILPPEEAQNAFERIMGGNELQDVNYLSRGARAAMAVARIRSPTPDGQRRQFGSGFMIAPELILTNNHVIASAEAATQSQADFNYQLDDRGEPFEESVFSLAPGRFFFTDRTLDFTVCAVDPLAGSGKQQVLSFFGELPLVATLGKAVDCEWLTIVQHPDGKRKMICVRDNQLLKRAEDVLWYSSDTLGGSSGSPVFNNDWYVVALHHSGVPEKKNGKIQTTTGRDFDPAIDGETDIKWVANEGIRASRIVERLKEVYPEHPLLQPLYNATPQSARVAASVPRSEARPARAVPAPHLTQSPQTLKGTPMARTVQVTLRIDDNGNATVVSSQERESLTVSGPAIEVARVADTDGLRRGIKVPVRTDAQTLAKLRKGFIPDFLSKEDRHYVNLPELSPALQKVAAPLIGKPKEYELDYIGYTVVMNAKRKLAMYSAASLDFCFHPRINSRTGWKRDDRILDEHQLDDSYYERHRPGYVNRFDRGHLTRNEDMEYGQTPAEAAERASDSFYYTNCVPQHESFNRQQTAPDGKRYHLWRDLECYILERNVRSKSFRAQVITGPVLAENDPKFEAFGDIRYPRKFWKIAIAISASNELVAAAFVLDQSAVIADNRLEAAEQQPFQQLREFQVEVKEVERLTNLRFTVGKNDKRPLSDFDPKKDKVFIASRSATSPLESAAAAPAPEGYLPLDGFDSIILE